MLRDWIIIDVASAPLPDADAYLEGAVRAPKNYGAEAAAKYVAEKTAERAAMAALDIDLARITGIGVVRPDYEYVGLCKTEDDERQALRDLDDELQTGLPIITFGGFNFDLPLLMRRAKYLGVPFSRLNLDRYRSPHIDLCDELADRNPQRRRSLQFYAKRLGWTDIHKTLDGAEEAKVHETGRWDDLRASLTHDITATRRLAEWHDVIERVSLQEASGF